MKIICIEDDIDILETTVFILKMSGYETEAFVNGVEIMAGNFDSPGLFIIDRRLPVFSGFEICRHLKANEATRDIPVLILSASPDGLQLSKEAGANDFLEKPFDLKDLLTKVKLLTNNN